MFSTIWKGWFYGVTAIFLPITLLASIVVIFAGGNESPLEMILSVFMVPIIAAIQGVIVGGIVVFGLFIASIVKPDKPNDAQ